MATATTTAAAAAAAAAGEIESGGAAAAAVAGAGAGGGEQQLRLRNRLAESRSPYVRGHRNNPVAWQMWTPETLELAKKSQRLLFVSIGYAACHWCHVMERESFENQQVASILNADFIPIKIDREERPDIDRIYMNYVQATTGGGGWPLNVFVTPDLEPLFGGTYWPGPGSTTPGLGHGMDFVGILEKIREVWVNQRQRCLESAKEITQQLRAFAQEGNVSRTGDGSDGDGSGSLELELLDDAYEHFAAKYDRTYGGFSRAPKFPTPVNLKFLIRIGQAAQEVRDIVGDEDCKKALEMAVHTLESMARGGIKDQVGNGFARYSVTRDWSLPHFEKMLYDQGQLLPVYLDAYLLTKSPILLEMVHDIAAYLTAPPLAAPTGGFFSAEDADSLYRPNDAEKREGAFYVWTLKEFQQVLGERDAQVLARYYNVLDEGNVAPEHDAHDELLGQNVLAINATPETLAKEFGLEMKDVHNVLQSGRAKLRAHREKERPRPALDDKIVVGWNGLAIGALARTSAAIESLEPEKAKAYLAAAEKAAAFIRTELYDDSTGAMRRVYREGPGDAPAFADDFAFLISGLIDLYEATWDEEYLAWADKLQKTQLSLFWDAQKFGFFATPAHQPDILLRLKDALDNAEPSTNGLSASNLFRLSAVLDDAEYAALAARTAAAFEAEVLQHPFLFASLMEPIAAMRLGMRSLLLTGEGEEVDAVVKRLRGSVKARRTVVRLKADGGGWLRGRNEVLRDVDGGKVAVQVCEKGTCRVLDKEEVDALVA